MDMFYKIVVGNAMSVHRKDGRYLIGEIVSVRRTSKGMLVVLKSTDANMNPVHKSVYMEDVETYSVCEIAHR